MTFEKINEILKNNLSATHYIGVAISSSFYCYDSDMVNVKFYIPKQRIAATYAENVEKILYQCDMTKNNATNMIKYLRNYYNVNFCSQSDMKFLIYHIRLG